MGKARDFFNNVVTSYQGRDCLIWPFATQRGHASIKVPNETKVVRVCTLLCEQQYGPKPTPLHEVRHSCGKGDRGCVANAHVSWSTHKENCADRTTHGTEVAGERNGQAKLTLEQVEAMRQALADGESQSSVGKRYGVSQPHVSDIHLEIKWRR